MVMVQLQRFALAVMVMEDGTVVDAAALALNIARSAEAQGYDNGIRYTKDADIQYLFFLQQAN